MGLSIPESQWIKLKDGLALHYLDWGKDTRLPALIALHGSLTTCRTWDFAADRLKGKYRLIALDLRGFGDTRAHPENCSTIRMAEDLHETITRLELAPCHLIGHSMGTRVAGKFGVTHPELVKSLILVETSDFSLSKRRTDPAVLAARPDRFSSYEEVIEYLKEHEGKRWPEEWVLHHAYAMTEKDPEGKIRHKVPTPVLLKVRGTDGPDFFPLASKMTFPTLIMRGSDSSTLAPEEARSLAGSIEKSQLVEVAQAGHFIMQEQFEAFINHVETFLSSVK